VAVAEDGGRAVEQRAFGVGAGSHHRALDVDVRIDEAGREDAAGGVEDFGVGPALENLLGRCRRV